MPQICGHCSGSGNDPVAPTKARCIVCLGSGMVYGDTPTPPAPPGGGGGGAALVLLLLVVFCGYIVGAGYVLSSEMVFRPWTGDSYTEHNWYHVGIYTGSSLLAVALVARYFGVLAGFLVGLMPALPLLHATKGGVGFWFIVHNGGEDVLDNVFTSWVAFLGMMALNILVARAVQRPEEGFCSRMLRWRWIFSPSGAAATVVLLVTGSMALSIINDAIRDF